MTKKEYMKPVIELDEFDMEEELLAYSVTSTGLGDNTEDNLKQVEGETSGDSWNDALSRRGAWEE